MGCMNPQGKRIAQEAQLLAEERFIVNALKKMRTHRNCLQIERLQLESMTAQNKFNQMSRGQGGSRPGTASSSVVTSTAPQSTVTETTGADSHSQLVSICNPLTASMDKARELNEELCNFEELNLSVTLTQSVFNIGDLNMNIEFEEDDSSEDVESDDPDNEENVEIDMNMFMNAETKE